MGRMILVILCVALVLLGSPAVLAAGGISAVSTGEIGSETTAQQGSLTQEQMDELLIQAQQGRRQYMLSIFGMAAIILAGFTFGSKWADKKLNKGKNLRGEKKFKK